jgi:hypothetical protein
VANRRIRKKWAKRELLIATEYAAARALYMVAVEQGYRFKETELVHPSIAWLHMQANTYGMKALEHTAIAIALLGRNRRGHKTKTV